MGDYELYHAATRKHKYIKKIGDRYFYTQQEIAAYLRSKEGKDIIEKDVIEKDVVEKDKIEKDDYGVRGKNGPHKMTKSEKLAESKKKTVKMGEGSVKLEKNPDYNPNKKPSSKNQKYRVADKKEIQKRGRKKLKKMATTPARNLKKQAARGKKALDKWYTKATTPDITVTYGEAKLK